MKCLIIVGLLALLAACEKYTDKTSPCFGKSGKPVVSRAAANPLSPLGPGPTGDCVFEDVRGPS